MTAKILVVDDEPDVEDLVRQKFRRQIKDGSIAFEFAHDGVEALALLGE
jgi:CheY-like chemotaxis protein